MTDSPEGGAAEWPVLNVTVDHETPWFSVGRDTVERPGGATADYHWIDPTDAVAVVAYDDDAGEVILVEQYRPRFRRRFRSCPGGEIEPGEEPAAAAARELEEETGYRAGTLDHLGSYHPSVWDRYTRHVVYATDLSAGAADPDDGEELVVHRVSVDDAVRDALTERSVGWAVTPLLWARETGHL